MNTEENPNDQSISNLPIRQESENKPLFGISLLSIAVILFNLWFLISLLAKRDELITGNGLPIYSIPVSLNYFIVLCVVCIIGVVVGVTFWLGKSWSWWIVVFYCIYSTFGSIKSIILLIENENLIYAIRGVSLYVMVICFLTLIVLYLFENSVFDYYNLNKSRKYNYGAYLVTSAIVGVVLRIFFQA